MTNFMTSQVRATALILFPTRADDPGLGVLADKRMGNAATNLSPGTASGGTGKGGELQQNGLRQLPAFFRRQLSGQGSYLRYGDGTRHSKPAIGAAVR